MMYLIYLIRTILVFVVMAVAVGLILLAFAPFLIFFGIVLFVGACLG